MDIQDWNIGTFTPLRRVTLQRKGELQSVTILCMVSTFKNNYGSKVLFQHQYNRYHKSFFRFVSSQVKYVLGFDPTEGRLTLQCLYIVHDVNLLFNYGSKVLFHCQQNSNKTFFWSVGFTGQLRFFDYLLPVLNVLLRFFILPFFQVHPIQKDKNQATFYWKRQTSPTL